MKELNQQEMQEASGGFFEIFAILACSYLFYQYMCERGYFQAQDFGRWL